MMDIERINKRHFVHTENYYRAEKGLSSKLLKYQNGVFHIEVVVHRKWKKNLNAAAAEMAYTWRDSNKELKGAIGCKVYLINVKDSDLKRYLLNTEITPSYDAKKGVLFYRQYMN